MHLVGGITLSIDLSQAFDTVPRSLMIHALLEAGVPHLLYEWHRASVYHLKHCGLEAAVETGRGVRQGCVISPLIYACVTGYLVKQFARQAGMAWCQKHLTMFADDNLITATFHDEATALSILATMGKFLDFLQEHGLRTNLGKSAALMQLAGKGKRTFLKRHVSKCDAATYVVLPGGHEPWHLPLVGKQKYMGAYLSYDSFENATFSHGLECGRSNYIRLRRFLHHRRTLTLKDRVRMWSTCVWTTPFFHSALTLYMVSSRLSGDLVF